MHSCQGCTRRYVGCHSKCSEYIEYSKARTANNDKKREESGIGHYSRDSFTKQLKSGKRIRN